MPRDANRSDWKKQQLCTHQNLAKQQFAVRGCCAECGWGSYTSLVTHPWGPTPVYEPESGSVSSPSFCQTCCQVQIMWGFSYRNVYSGSINQLFIYFGLHERHFSRIIKLLPAERKIHSQREARERRIFQYWFSCRSHFSVNTSHVTDGWRLNCIRSLLNRSSLQPRESVMCVCVCARVQLDDLRGHEWVSALSRLQAAFHLAPPSPAPMHQSVTGPKLQGEKQEPCTHEHTLEKARCV